MITVEFNKEDKERLLKALSKVDKRAKTLVVTGGGELCRESAEQYSNFVAYTIMSQKFKIGYKRYHEKYAIWKAKKYPSVSRKFWVLTGKLLASLSAFKEGNYWMGGLRKGTKPGIKKTNVAAYARENETIRPLFGNAMDDFSESNTFKNVGEKGLKEIEKEWS